MHLLCSHTWCTYRQSWCSQKHQTHNHFTQFVYECVCLLVVFATLYIFWALEQNWRCLESCVLFSFAGKTQWLAPTIQISHTFQVGHSMFICPLLGAMATSFACTQQRLCLQFSQSGHNVFLCWIKGNLTFLFTILAIVPLPWRIREGLSPTFLYNWFLLTKMVEVVYYVDAWLYFFHPLCCRKKINRIVELLLLSVDGVVRFLMRTTTLLHHPHEWWWSSYVGAQDNKGYCVLHWTIALLRSMKKNNTFLPNKHHHLQNK